MPGQSPTLSAAAPAARLHRRALHINCPAARPYRAPVYKADDLPRTQALAQDMLRLPVFPQAADELLEQYLEAFGKVLRQRRAIAPAADGPPPAQ